MPWITYRPSELVNFSDLEAFFGFFEIADEIEDHLAKGVKVILRFLAEENLEKVEKHANLLTAETVLGLLG